MGCTRSPLTIVTTAIATPEGLQPPSVDASERGMQIRWSEPARKNAPSLMCVFS